MYGVISYSIYTLKVKMVDEEKEKEFLLLKENVERLRSALLDETWTSSVESKIRSSKENCLEMELSVLFNKIDLNITSSKNLMIQKESNKLEDEIKIVESNIIEEKSTASRMM